MAKSNERIVKCSFCGKPQEVVKLGRKFEDAVKSADNYGK